MTENITINTHSSIRIGGKNVLYFDPFNITKESHDADAIFITHNHYDHFSPEDIAKVAKNDTILIVPEGMLNQALKKSGIDEEHIKSVKSGQIVEIPGGYLFQTVPAYNKLKPFHPKRSGWCGYIVSVEGVKYYIAGDTDDNADNREVKCDVALVPVGGTYTMNPKEAAAFVNTIRPQVAIPTHYGSIAGKPEDGKKFQSLVNDMIKVELKL